MTFTYEIIATLGPASQQPETWVQMRTAGASGFRLNTSHLTLDALDDWLEHLAPIISPPEGPSLPLVLDLQGSKWRLGSFAPFDLLPGQEVELVLAADSGQPGVLPVPHADFFRAAQTAGGAAVLNDAKIRLEILSAAPDQVRARVAQGGEIRPNKGITLPGSPLRAESLGEKDRAILQRAAGLDFVRYAISYVRDSAEMAGYRALVQSALGRPGYLIAKLERQPALREAAQLAQHADEVWLCRGDLGAELGLRAMAEASYAFGQQVRSLPVPALLAGQVLEHLTARPAPTRSEITALHDALALGYRGVVLSDETATGPHPLEACRAAALFRM